METRFDITPFWDKCGAELRTMRLMRLIPSGKFSPLYYQEKSESPDENGRLRSGKSASSATWYLSFLSPPLNDSGGG
jgi:hypothetical protein